MIKYTIDGNEIAIVTEMTDGCMVRNNYEDIENDSAPAYFLLNSQIYATPPMQKRHAYIATLDADIAKKLKHYDEISKDLDNSKKELETIKKELETIVNRIASFADVQKITDFAEGKITHLVSHSNFEIIPVESMSDGKKYLKALSLNGKCERGLFWKLHNYSDGSDYGQHVTPCYSLSDALTVCSDLVKYYVSDKHNNEYMRETAIKTAIAKAIEIPIDVLSEYLRKVKDIKAKRLAKCKTDFDAAQDDYNDFIQQEYLIRCD